MAQVLSPSMKIPENKQKTLTKTKTFRSKKAENPPKNQDISQQETQRGNKNAKEKKDRAPPRRQPGQGDDPFY